MSAWTANLRFTPILNDPPAFLTGEDSIGSEEDAESVIRYWEKLLGKYGRHPYLLVRYAIPLLVLCAGQALALLEEALEEMAARDEETGAEFEASIDDLRDRFDRKMQAELSGLDDSMSDYTFAQPWVPATLLPLPRGSTLAPGGHAEVRSDWTLHFSQGSDLFQKYMRALAIETNHIEGAFLIEDVSQTGIAAHRIAVSPRSKIQDPRAIEAILKDTLSAYDLVYPLAEDLSKLTPEAICKVHRCSMDTERFQGRYIPAGVMRSATGHSAYIDRGPGKRIQCCPPNHVEDEIYNICDLARKYIEEEGMNPFALAAWLHLALVRCLPFDDGNGRTTRLIASIPLIRHGYPPISVPLTDRETYFEAINQAYKGNFVPLSQSILKGMQAGMRKAREPVP